MRTIDYYVKIEYYSIVTLIIVKVTQEGLGFQEEVLFGGFLFVS
jgi:hypothetical protein